MNRLPEIELMRLLHGELPPERAVELQERLAREPELAEELRRLEASWDRLELPPAAPTPRGFARAVVGRAESGGLWSVAPTRIRAAAFGMVAGGLALGIGLASGLAGTPEAPSFAPAPGLLAAAPATPTVPSVVMVPTAPAVPIIRPEPATPGERTAEATAPSVHPTASPSPAGAQVADLDLPADGETFADEGTLADDFWQAYNGTETGAAATTGLDIGSGSEDL